MFQGEGRCEQPRAGASANIARATGRHVGPNAGNFLLMATPRNPRNPTGKKHRFGKAWMHEHVSDHWVQEAQRRGYRSRAAFKLIELAEKDKLLRPGMSVVDLGSAPGSWCQVLRERLGPTGRIIALDLLEMARLADIRFIQGDFRDEAVLRALESALGGAKVDLVVSDLAPNISGVDAADQARSIHLGDLALKFATNWLQRGGNLVIKSFQGEGFSEFQAVMKGYFDKVYVRKPKSSRDRSREVYLVGKEFQGLSSASDKLNFSGASRP